MVKRPVTLDFIKDKLSPILRSHEIVEAKIFGSYAKGWPTRNSDVNIYVDSGLQGDEFLSLLEEIMAVMPMEVDLIDKQTLLVGSPLFCDIMETGVDILQPEEPEGEPREEETLEKEGLAGG